MKQVVIGVAFCLVLLIVGCESAFGPEQKSAVVAEQATAEGEVLEKGGRIVNSVTGVVHHFDHGEFHSLSNVLLKHEDGTVSGQIQSIARISGVFIHAVPVCLRVEGNKAWGAVIVTNSNIPPLVGAGFGQAVIDNDQGAGAPPDRFSGPFPTADPFGWCENPDPDVDISFRDIERGNLQVR